MLTINVSRRHLFLLVLAFVMIVPLAAYAGSVFDDVDDTDTHIDGITFMKDSGVSVGCDANNNYCPEDNVTRAQMGTFMYRLSGNDPATDPSVNADMVDGYEASDLVRAAGTNYSTNGTPVATGNTESLMEVTIDAPVDGVLVVNASANLFCSGGFIIFPLGAFSCDASTGNTYINVDGTQYARQYFAIEGGDSSLNAAAWNSSNSAYVPVSAGSHTIALDVQNQSGDGPTYVWSGGLNAVFMPFGGNGSTPSGAVPSSVDQAEEQAIVRDSANG